MARGLYRLYLYVVTIALAIYATVSLASLLGALFSLTPLRGSAPAPGGLQLTQTVTFFAISMIVVAALGGLHYWLIRRDMAGDPEAHESSVRAFTLNVAEGVTAIVAVASGVIGLGQLGSYYGSDVTVPLGSSVAAFALAAVLTWERRRATPTHGAALIFQRLRLHGVPLALLAVAGPALASSLGSTERLIAQASGHLVCAQPNTPSEGLFPICAGPETGGQWAATVLALAAWLAALWLSRRDLGSLIRQITTLLGWLAGMVALVYAIERAVEFALHRFVPGATPMSYLMNYDFGPALGFAVVALAVYGWALRATETGAPMDALSIRLTMRALGALALAGPFWYGVYELARLTILAASTAVAADSWVNAAAFAVSGAAYIPLSLWLGATSRAEGVMGPRRGSVLALLAAGALVTAGGAATLLYTFVTQLLGAPLSNWQDIARTAGAALIAGVALGATYLIVALRERLFVSAPKAPREAPAPAASLDEALAQFKRGDISQGAAAERIRELARDGALV